MKMWNKIKDYFQNNNKKLWIMGLILVIVVISVVVLGTQKKSTIYDSGAVTFQNKSNKKAVPGQMIVPAFGTLTAYSGSKKIPVQFGNNKSNQVCLKFTVTVLKPHREVLLNTKLVKPGKAIVWMKMPKNSAIGSYPIEIKTTAYALSGIHQKLNGAAQKTTLNIVKK